jgi:hypothetical protein
MVGLRREETRVAGELEESSLRAAGLRGYPLGLIAVRVRPPNGLESTFDDLGPLDGEHILADSVPLLCYQVGRQSTLSAHHPMLRVRTRSLSPRPRSTAQPAVRALTALGESSVPP